jgi:outer membrane protein assembly factor BamA
VRGWSPDLLGPKVPDFDVTRRGDSIVLRSADRYVPLGGLARFTASVELRVPMPLTEGRHDVFGFLDGGRVWIPDDRFVPDGGLGDDDGTRFRGAAGAGLQFATPVGPLRIAAGYKLNPSALDLRDPGLVGDALLRGDPPASVPEQPLRRWHVHLSIGGSF